MRHPSPLVVEVIAPFAGRTIALSTDPEDCRLILQRLAARKQREAREVLDPATVAVILTEVERYEKLIAVVSAARTAARPKKQPDQGSSRPNAVGTGNR
jgi:hypothetical protein